ncbi:unnamed protein product [Cylicostephanus goldi]|uniref:Uncharacterized protein n=1 Tax=Cylicostephanus goldi TaxID=71465 RepID=A0A3P6QRV9_CYLGO|nr:unnamed protein product [Cylicostephanus goldi]
MLFTYIFISNLIFLAHAFFTKHFAEFLERDYGTKFKDLLQRSDLGGVGSFGGKTYDEEVLVHDPVVFVHGVSDVAGLRMQAVANRYK